MAFMSAGDKDVTVWHGFRLPLRQRTDAGSAGLAPPLPVRYQTENHISIVQFRQRSQTACAALATALDVALADMNRSGAGGHGQPAILSEDLDVSDLWEPGPMQIHAATTCEETYVDPGQGQPLDTRWQPWAVKKRRAAAAEKSKSPALTEQPRGAAIQQQGQARGGGPTLQQGQEDGAAARRQECTQQIEMGRPIQTARKAAQRTARSATPDLPLNLPPLTEAVTGQLAMQDQMPAACPSTSPMVPTMALASASAAGPSTTPVVPTLPSTQSNEASVAASGHAAIVLHPPGAQPQPTTHRQDAVQQLAAHGPQLAATGQATQQQQQQQQQLKYAESLVPTATGAGEARDASPEAIHVSQGQSTVRPSIQDQQDITTDASGVAACITTQPSGRLLVRHKTREEIKPEEWAGLYKQHAWLYQALQVTPPGVAPALPAPSPSTAVFGPSPATNATATAGTAAAAAAAGAMFEPSQAAVQSSTAHEHAPPVQQALPWLHASDHHEDGDGDVQHHVLCDTASAVFPALMGQWRLRLEAAVPALACLRELEASPAEGLQGYGEGEDAGGDRGEAKTKRKGRSRVTPEPLHMRLAKAARIQWENESKAQRGRHPPGSTSTLASTGSADGASRGLGFTSPLTVPMPAPLRPAAAAAAPEGGCEVEVPGVPSIRHGPAVASLQDEDVNWQKEVLVTIGVYSARRADMISDEFILLGSQPLTAALDCIRCVTRVNLEAVGKQGSGASCFFIQGRFYNDTRDSKAIDLSAPILSLCSQMKAQPSHVDVRLGAERRMITLPPSLAAPAVYAVSCPQDMAGMGTAGGAAGSSMEHDQGAAQVDPGAGQASLRDTGRAGVNVPGNGRRSDGGMRPVDVNTDGSGVVFPGAAAVDTCGQAPASTVTGPHVVVQEGTGLSRHMQQTRIDELNVRLSNAPTYVFVHLGNCEHYVQIRDVRCMHPADPCKRSAYPLSLLPAKPARPTRRCDACEGRTAMHVVYDDPLGPNNPAFYCQACLGMLHPDGLPKGASIFPYQEPGNTAAA